MLEGVTVASKSHRLYAFILDIVLFFITLGVGFILWSLIIYARGLTPGKQLMRLRVVDSHANPIKWKNMFIREIVLKWGCGFVAFLLFLIVGLVLGFLIIIIDSGNVIIAGKITSIATIGFPVGISGLFIWYIPNGLTVLFNSKPFWHTEDMIIIKETYSNRQHAH